MQVRIVSYLLSMFLLFLVPCSCSKQAKDLETTAASIQETDLIEDVKILSSDAFEGRAPGTPGEDKTIAHIAKEFRALGLQPGNGDSYFQEIPLVEITAGPDAVLTVTGSETGTFSYATDFVAASRHMSEHVELNGSELVFVGYGIVAPEYGWNDYAGLDVSGKTVVMLVNDPGFATGDTTLFQGKAMTYYGRWTYKYEEATRQGADGALIIHETEPAAYPWAVVNNSFTGPQLNFIDGDRNMSRVDIEGWVTIRTAREMFRLAGKNFDDLKARSAQGGFKPVLLNLEVDLALENTVRETVSNNVLALLPGGKRKDEYIIYASHWDHFGIDRSRAGDQIYNGALDNATGVAGLIEIAEAFTKLKHVPARSVLFVAVTAEEQGLLGSDYYARNPVFPLEKTAAAINMDALNILGRMRDITVIGYGQSELDRYVAEEARLQDRVVRPDPTPEKGSFFRSDHFSFAKQGVPALYAGSGTDHVDHGSEWTLAQREKYVFNRYHKPSDEYDPDWDLSGAIEDLRMLYRIGYKLANQSVFPAWSERSEFKHARK